MKLIVGLGNPGWLGRGTPHNFGRMVAAKFCGEVNEGSRENWTFLWDCMCWEQQFNNKTTVVLPGLFINGSGWCLQRYISKRPISINEILLIADDLRYPIGITKMTKSIVTRHNGLLDISHRLKTSSIRVLSVGAQRPNKDVRLPYSGLLQSVPTELSPKVDSAITQSVEMVVSFCNDS